MTEPLDTSTEAAKQVKYGAYDWEVVCEMVEALAAERDSLAQRVQELEETILGAGGWDERCKKAESALSALQQERDEQVAYFSKQASDAMDIRVRERESMQKFSEGLQTKLSALEAEHQRTVDALTEMRLRYPAQGEAALRVPTPAPKEPSCHACGGPIVIGEEVAVYHKSCDHVRR